MLKRNRPITFLCILPVLLFCFSALAHEHSKSNETNSENSSDAENASNNSSRTKPSLATDDDRPTVVFGFAVDNGAITRMMYVLVGLTALLVLYFGVKIWRSRRKSTNIRRYDVLSTNGKKDFTLDSESEDEVFDDAHVKLVKSENPT